MERKQHRHRISMKTGQA